MDAVLKKSGIGRLDASHRCDFLVGKAIGFQIRKTPVRIAEIVPRPVGLSICIDGRCLLADCFERMPVHQVKVCAIGSFCKRAIVNFHCNIVVADRDALIGECQFEIKVIGFPFAQYPGLLQ